MPETRKTYQPKTLQPKGKLSCKIAIVGEFPDKKGAQLGELFYGPAGSMIKDYIHQNKLSVSQVYLTTVIKEYPYKGYPNAYYRYNEKTKVGTFTEKGQRCVDQLKIELEKCEARLRKEKQFNRKVTINAEHRAFKQEIKTLARPLGEGTT